MILSHKEPNVNYYGLYEADAMNYCRFINDKCYCKVSKTREEDLTKLNPDFAFDCEFYAIRITEEQYEAADPKDYHPAFLREDVIDRALALMQKAHAAQKDKSGGPEVLHPLRVGMAGKNKSEMIVGFLHDTVEDGRLTKDDFEIAGLTGEQIGAIFLLTHRKGSYEDYVKRIIDSKNELAIAVKLNDLRDNLKRGREGGFTETVRKHEAALKMFEDAGYPARR